MFEHRAVLGYGTHSVVFKSNKKEVNVEYAVKRIQFRDTEKDRAKIDNEIRALALLTECPNIVRYYDSWFEFPSRESQVTGVFNSIYSNSLVPCKCPSQHWEANRQNLSRVLPSSGEKGFNLAH